MRIPTLKQIKTAASKLIQRISYRREGFTPDSLLGEFLKTLDGVINLPSDAKVDPKKQYPSYPIFQTLEAVRLLSERHKQDREPPILGYGFERTVRELDPLLSELHSENQELYHLIANYHSNDECRNDLNKLIADARSRYHYDDFDQVLSIFSYKFRLNELDSVDKPATDEEVGAKFGLKEYLVSTKLGCFEDLLFNKDLEIFPRDLSLEAENSVLEQLGSFQKVGNYHLYNLIRNYHRDEEAKAELDQRLEDVRNRYLEDRFDPVDLFICQQGFDEKDPGTTRSFLEVAKKIKIGRNDTNVVKAGLKKVVTLLLDPSLRIINGREVRPTHAEKTIFSIKAIKKSVEAFNEAYYKNNEYSFTVADIHEARMSFREILISALKLCNKFTTLTDLSNEEITAIYPSRIDGLFIRSLGFLSNKLESFRADLGFKEDFNTLCIKLFGAARTNDIDEVREHIQKFKENRIEYLSSEYEYLRREVRTINKLCVNQKSEIYQNNIDAVRKYAKNILIAFLFSRDEIVSDTEIQEALNKPGNLNFSGLSRLVKFKIFGLRDFVINGTHDFVKPGRGRNPSELDPYIRLLISEHRGPKGGQISTQSFEESVDRDQSPFD